jgi:hypothetical protein
MIVIGVGVDRTVEMLNKQKHTNDCQLLHVSGGQYTFRRPNDEVFEMYFVNPPNIPVGAEFDGDGITYTDAPHDMRTFIKAKTKFDTDYNGKKAQ